jgi:hypothetical protein
MSLRLMSSISSENQLLTLYYEYQLVGLGKCTDSAIDLYVQKESAGPKSRAPFGFDHEGASALTAICRTVGAIAPVSGFLKVPQHLAGLSG